MNVGYGEAGPMHAMWKSPVEGRRMVRKLNVIGDAQAEVNDNKNLRICLLALLPSFCGTFIHREIGFKSLNEFFKPN
ncbi:MAG TPA: hypothetical protein VGF61_24825, partial [Candidatus Acidoferrum sp.]